MNLADDPVIVLDANDWHHGVIGIVSSRITEKYARPSILVSFEGNEDIADPIEHVGKGSGRSVKGLNLVDALCYCSDHLVKFGGHELAAGLSVKRSELDAFRKKINEYAKENLHPDDMIPTFEADCVIDFDDVKLNLVHQLGQLEPYGIGNPTPMFVVRGIWVNEISSVSQGKHTRLSFTNGDHNVTGMYFSASSEEIGLFTGDKVDVLFNLDINEWMGRKNVQMIVKDIKRADGKDEINEQQRARFWQIWNGETFSEDENVLPTREDFATVYRFVVNACRAGYNTFTVRDLISRLSRIASKSKIGYIKLKIIIKIFNELNLLGIEESSEDTYVFTVRLAQKTDLEKSNLLRRLRSQQRKI